MKITQSALLLSAFLTFSGFAAAQEYTVPLGSAMEEFAYPFPVKFFPLTHEGHDLRMAYMDVPAKGSAAGTIVLLHGKNFYGSYFENTAKALSEAGYRVIVPDQIGFGKSSKPDIPYSFDLLAANTIALLDSLKIEKFAVLGHSMGGILATRIERNYSDRVEKLVLENPIGLEDYRIKVPPVSTEEAYKSELNTTNPAGIRKFLGTYVVKWEPEVFERFVEVRSRVALGGEYPRWAKAAALTYQMIYQQPIVYDFPHVKAKTLVAIGLHDQTTLGRNIVSEDVRKTLGNYRELGKATAKAIPNSVLVEYEDAAHIPHLEIPEKFHKDLINFLKQ